MLDNRHLGSEGQDGPKMDKAERKTDQNIEESQKHGEPPQTWRQTINVKEKVQPCKKTCQRAQATLDNRRDV
jgi:hypothetical protein